MGNKANPFQINNDTEHTSNIINNIVFDWLDLSVIKGTFGNGIGLSIKTPRVTTSAKAILESP